MLVIAGFQVMRRVHALDRVAELIDVVVAAREAGDEHPEHAFLPLAVEDRLVFFRVDGADAVHAAQIVYAVHALSPRSNAGS